MKSVICKFVLCVNLLFFLALITSCSQINKEILSNTDQGKLQFSVQSSLLQSQKIKSKQFSTQSTDSTPTAAAIIVTLTDSSGAVVKDQVKLELLQINDEYISSPISLAVGNYSLTDFLVVDKDNKVIYLAPKKDSAQARFVNSPLPVSVVVEKEKTSSIIPEVVELTPTTSATDYGYPSFKFNVVTPLDFKLAIKDSDGLLISANISIEDTGVILYEGVLLPIINQVSVKSIADAKSYTIIISKPGYELSINTITKQNLAAYTTNPLIISLNKEAGKYWSQVAYSGFSARYGQTSLEYNNKLWVIAGNDSALKNDTWYSSNGTSWLKMETANTFPARSQHTSVNFNNQLWVIGGWAANDATLNDVWAFDGTNWNQLATNAGFSARRGHASVVFNGKMWVIGGFDGVNYKNDVWSSVDGVTWIRETVSASFAARGFYSAVVFNNKIWVIGGFDGTNRRNDVWNSSDGITWSKVSDAPFIGRAYHTSVVFNGKIWVMAGNNEDYLSDVWCSSDGVTWVKNTPVSESFSARNKHSSCVFNNKIWVINGYNSANTYLNDIWTTGTN